MRLAELLLEIESVADMDLERAASVGAAYDADPDLRPRRVGRDPVRIEVDTTLEELIRKADLPVRWLTVRVNTREEFEGGELKLRRGRGGYLTWPRDDGTKEFTLVPHGVTHDVLRSWADAEPDRLDRVAALFAKRSTCTCSARLRCPHWSMPSTSAGARAERRSAVDWVGLLLKLSHIALAMALVAGLVGRWILLTRASRTDDVEQAHLLADLAGPFEHMVQRSSPLLMVAGMATAWAQGYDWLGMTTGWMLLSVVLIIPILVMIPTVFLPRGRVFEQEMAAARATGQVTPGLRAAWDDSAVAFARRYEVAAIAIIVVLMVLKPF